MLEPLTHPLACLVYFIALSVGIGKLLGNPASTLGFLGRSLLFTVAGLGVSAAAVLSWSYKANELPEALVGPLYLPVLVLLLPLLGTLVAMLTSRPREVFPVTLGAVSGVLFLALSLSCPY